MTWTRRAWCLIPFLVSGVALGGCGTQTTTAGAAGSTPAGRECPDTPVWDLAMDPSRVPVDATGVSPEAAVRSLAEGRGIGVEVTSTKPVTPGGDPEDDLELDVVDDLGRDGTYTVAEIQGIWAVSSGEGCGAPSPKSFDDKPDCPTPSDLPTPSGDETLSYMVIC